MSEIIDDYRQSLNELTFNSRPIIDTLTTIAAENVNVAGGILDAISNRIYKCIPEQKLFTLYLLDSICKNIGNPYNTLVGDQIFKLFSHVYLLVDDTIRRKLLNLYETWKLTKTKGTGLPLFPPQELEKIGSFLQKANPNGMNGSNEGSANVLSNAKLIKDIDELLPIFQNRLNSNSNDSKLKDRFNALNQLRILLLTQQMQINELKAVENQLNNIRHQELNKNVPSSNPSSATSTPTLNSRLPVSLPAIPQERHVSKSNELFDKLINYGIVTFEQELTGPRIYDINYPKAIVERSADSLLNQMLNNQVMRSDYDQMKYNELGKLKLGEQNLQNFVSKASVSIQCKNLLYESKGLKCSVCGKRFNNDQEGQSRKRLHLDWHFRINKKLQTSHNVQSRNWFLDDIEWVKFRDVNLLEFQVESSSDQQYQQQADQQQNPKEIPYVVIPGNETNMNNKCLICREQVKGTFNEEIGEWCWYNCIIQPGEPNNSRKIVHSTCYNETRKRNAQDDLNSNFKREKY